MDFDPAARRSAIESALREYQRLPGKHAQGQRQPALLFAWIHEILQLAGGRAIDGEGGRPPDASLQQSARFFVQRAMLFPGADHYALLGLDRSADTSEIKGRYRQLMRLIHPDFAGSPGAMNWPADAATRVNQAYEVLSSTAQRRSYDQQQSGAATARTPAAAAGPARPVPSHVVAKAKPASEDPRKGLRGLAAVFGVAGALVLVGALAVNAPSDKGQLVQRADPPARLAAATAPIAGKVGPAPAPEPAAEASPAPVTATAAPSPASIAAVMGAALSPLPAPAAQPAPVAAPMKVALVAPTRPEPPPPAIPPTLQEAQPLITRLLMEMESGQGDRVASVLERDAQSEPAARELVSHYNVLVDDMRPVRLGKVQIRSEPRDGRLVVTSRLQLHANDPRLAPRELAVQAEFAAREGGVVMTRLARVREQP